MPARVSAQIACCNIVWVVLWGKDKEVRIFLPDIFGGGRCNDRAAKFDLLYFDNCKEVKAARVYPNSKWFSRVAI